MTEPLPFEDKWKHVLSRAHIMMNHRIAMGNNLKDLMIARIHALQRHFANRAGVSCSTL